MLVGFAGTDQGLATSILLAGFAHEDPTRHDYAPARFMAGTSDGDHFIPPSSAPGGGSGTGDAARITGKVLIVDDEPLILMALSRPLRRSLGLDASQILTADSADAALQVYQAEGASIQVIISDMDMPRYDEGFRLRAEVKRLGFSGPFVIQSGRVDEDDPSAKALMAQDPLTRFFGKPWNFEEMKVWILQMLAAPAAS